MTIEVSETVKETEEGRVKRKLWTAERYCCDSLKRGMTGVGSPYHLEGRQGEPVLADEDRTEISYCPFCGAEVDIEIIERTVKSPIPVIREEMVYVDNDEQCDPENHTPIWTGPGDYGRCQVCGRTLIRTADTDPAEDYPGEYEEAEKGLL